MVTTGGFDDRVGLVHGDRIGRTHDRVHGLLERGHRFRLWVIPKDVRVVIDNAGGTTGAEVVENGDIVERVPMARCAAPDDIAEATAFLADPTASGFVNGVTLPIDSGC